MLTSKALYPLAPCALLRLPRLLFLRPVVFSDSRSQYGILLHHVSYERFPLLFMTKLPVSLVHMLHRGEVRLTSGGDVPLKHGYHLLIVSKAAIAGYQL